MATYVLQLTQYAKIPYSFGARDNKIFTPYLARSSVEECKDNCASNKFLPMWMSKCAGYMPRLFTSNIIVGSILARMVI